MNKTEQIASIRVGYVTFKIIQKNKENLDKEYLLYRCWYEPTAFGGVHHKALDGKFEFYCDALKTVAYCADRYHWYGIVPTPEQYTI